MITKVRVTCEFFIDPEDYVPNKLAGNYQDQIKDNFNQTILNLNTQENQDSIIKYEEL